MNATTKLIIERLRTLNNNNWPGKTVGSPSRPRSYVGEADTELYRTLCEDGYAVDMPDIDGMGYYPGPMLLDSELYRKAREGFEAAIAVKHARIDEMRATIARLEAEVTADRAALAALPQPRQLEKISPSQPEQWGIFLSGGGPRSTDYPDTFSSEAEARQAVPNNRLLYRFERLDK
jgi:hypothetical protein